MSPTERIEATKKFLTQLKEAVSKITSCDPESFQEGELGNSMKRFDEACEKSLQRLEKPSLRISTIGTTSSGKSTLVNAMIGRRLAPIEADEMSAGVLSFVHAEKSRMIVEPTRNAVWETGEWKDLDDEEIYFRLRATKEEQGYDGVMVSYHKEKKRRSDLEAPRVRVEAPILPVLFPELLELPEGIQFEILDLPGLKRVEDRQSLKVIQQQVKDTFSLVTLDYTQTDETSRAALLKELEEVVEAMYGRTDTMMFLLNKINLRSEDDQKIESRYEKLKKEIIEQLNLKYSPDLSGIDARLLYYVQCAWGADIKKPLQHSKRRTMFLENCMDDCFKIFRQKKKKNKEVKDWLNKNEDDLDKMADDDFKKLLRWAHNWSGGTQFWNTLKQRISRHFPELVIYPAVWETLIAFKDFAGKTEDVARIRKIETKEKIEEERERIAHNLSQLFYQIEDRKKEFCKSIKIDIEKLKDPAISNGMIRLSGSSDLNFSYIGHIREGLFFDVVNPVRDAFKQGSGVYDLEAILAGKLYSNDARRIAQSYDYYSREFMTQIHADNGLKLEFREGDEAGRKQLEKAMQRCQNLYHRMREGLSNRAELLLQKKSQTMEGIIINSLCSEIDEIVKMGEEYLGDYKKTIISEDFDNIIQANPIQLPDNFFDLPEPVRKTKSKEEKIGTEEYTYTTDDSCFNEQRTETRDKYQSISYHFLELPSADEMAEQWTSGIKLGENSLWEKLAEWITDTFESVLNRYSDTLVGFQKFVGEEFDKQIQFLEKEGEAEIKKWDEILENLEDARVLYENLKRQTITEEGD